MKLRNKKTGNIVVLSGITCKDDTTYIRFDDEKGNFMFAVCSLAELNEEWEDAPEEPKKHYEILAMSAVMEREDAEDEIFRNQGQREIGNYFETKEEAEKAVEKLKAWKRLKDKGFRFTLTPWVGSLDITPGKFQIEINADMPAKWFCCDAVQKDLDDCFGGEK